MTHFCQDPVSLVLQTGSAADTGGGPGLPQDCLH